MRDEEIKVRYSPLRALRKEVAENPLRCLLAFLNTIGVGLGVFTYVRETWFPEKSYVNASVIDISKTGDGWVGQISFAPLGVNSVVAVYGAVFLTGDKDERRTFSVTPELPGQPLRKLSFPFKNYPTRATVCINIENAKHALSKQVVTYDREGIVFRTSQSPGESGCPSWQPQPGGWSSSW